MPHKVVFPGHFLSGEGEGECYGQRQALGNSNDDDRDGRDENPEKVLAFFLGTIQAARKSGKKLDKQDSKEQQSCRAA